MFFDECKIILKNRDDYLKFLNQYIDVLHGKSSISDALDTFPIYLKIDGNKDMDITWTHKKKEYDKWKIPYSSIEKFMHMNYIITPHFVNRFNERYENVSYSRLKSLLKQMIKSGKRLKRKNNMHAIKYKTTSDYILFSNYDMKRNKKVNYIIVISNINILATIYEFNDKDIKYFKEIN